MMSIFKKVGFLLLFILCTVLDSSATHIVGGEIGYRCLGNNRYEINLRVFRDCDTGVPWFDSPASIGIFGSNNQLLFDLRPRMRENDTLDLNLSDPCLVAPPNVCIHTTSYRDTVTLPFRIGGYQLVYQRCCRNQDIVNIVSPLSSGATYYCLITENALTNCNSSPVFNDWPPVYICAGVPIIYDHSATDIDGDSLVYEMCTPLDGASTANPMPQPPFNPPYLSITWLPPYSMNNMLGGTDPLRINPQTGLLQGTPMNLGVFVVGICVKEYRNGVLISTSRRDFQYAVGICGQLTTAAFFAPEIQCNNSLMVQFQNNSQGLGTGYHWFFGDSTTMATSTLANPIYIYPDTGTYAVTLIVDPGSLCADTMTRLINLQYESIIMDFSLGVVNCSDSLRVEVTDLTVDTISTIVRWHWDFGNGDTSNVPYAATTYHQSGTYIVSLQVWAANGCTSTLRDTIEIVLPEVFSPDTVAICPGTPNVQLNQGGNASLQYQWSPAIGLSSTTVASPFANPPTNTTYTVTVTAFNGIDTCRMQKSITVIRSLPINLQAPPDTATCATNITLLASSDVPVSYVWSYSSTYDPVYSTQNPVSIVMPPPPSSINLYVRATDAYGCEERDTIQLSSNNSTINADFNYSIVNCGEQLVVQFNDQTTDMSQGPIVNWYWDFGNLTNSTSQNPQAVYTANGTYVVMMYVQTANGCSGQHLDTLANWVLPIMNSPDTVGICQGQTSVVLNPNGDPTLTYQWAPPTGLSSTTVHNPVASPSSPQTYYVTVTAVNATMNCVNVDTVHVNFPPPITVTVPPMTRYCGNSVTLTAVSPNAVSFLWSGDPSFFTILSTNNPETFFPTTFPFAGYYVRAYDAYGCYATAFAIVEQRTTPINVNFNWNAVSCADSMNIQFTDMTTDLMGTSVSSWLWTLSDGRTFTQQHPLITFRNSQAYTVTLQVTLANGCTGTMTQNLDLNIASINSPATIALCGGTSSVQLNPGGDPDNTYLWSPSTGLSSTTAPSPTATPPSSPYTYTVSVTANNSFINCSAVHNITIVTPPPLTYSIPQDTSFCVNSFVVLADLGPTVTRLEWSLNPQFNPIALVNNNPVSVSFGNFPSTLILYTRVFDQYGCSLTDTTYLRHITDPVIVNFAMIKGPCDNDSLLVDFQDLTADTSLSPIQSWAWNFGNGNTSNYQNPSFVFGASDTSHSISLTVTLANGCTGVFSDFIKYLVPDILGPDSIGLCSPGAVQLNPGGSTNMLYQWAPPTGLSSTTAASPIATVNGVMTYSVTVTAPNEGDTCQAVHQVYIDATPFVLEALPDTIICNNQIQLYVNSPNGQNFEWALDPNFTLLVGAGNPYLTNVNSSRWFYVRGQNAYGCTAYDSVYVQRRSTPLMVNFAMSPAYCGDSLVINFTDQTTDTIGNPITSWHWNFGNGDTSIIANPSATYLNSGSYTVVLTLNGSSSCNGQSSAPLVLNIPNIANMQDTIVSCGGVAVNLNPNADTSLSYQWSPASGLNNPNAPNPTFSLGTSQTYTVTLTAYSQLGSNFDTCQQVKTVAVIVPPTLLADAQAPNIICQPNLPLTASSNFGVSYAWSLDNTFNNIVDTNASWTTSLSQGQGNYFLLVTDAYGCQVTDSVQVWQRGINATINSAAVACPNQPASLLVTNLQPGDVLSYSWTPDSLILSGQATNTITSSPLDDANFQVIIQNQYACSDTLYSNVIVSNSTPALDIVASPDTIFIGQSSQLLATQDGFYTYSWQANNSLNANNIYNPLASPLESSTYWLTVTDASGCKNRDSIQIIVKPFVCGEPYVFVPNAFTPDGDGLNDLLFVRGNIFTELYFAVYNRWGELVFETNDQNRGWDGRYKGKELSPDVYGYYLRYKCIGQGPTDEYQLKKGNVTLIR